MADQRDQPDRPEPERFIDGGDVDLDQEVVYRKDGTRVTEAEAAAWGEEIAARLRRRVNPASYAVGPDATVEDVDLDEDPIVLSDGTVLGEAAAEKLGEEVAARWRRRRDQGDSH